MRIYLLLSLTFVTLSVFAETSFNVKKTELYQVKNKIEQLQKIIILDQEQQQNVEQELKKTEITIGSLGLEINSLNRSAAEEQTRLAILKKMQTTLLKKLQQEQTSLSQQLRTAYQLGHTNNLKIFLNLDDLNQIQRHLKYYRQLTEARLHLIENTRSTLDRLKQTMSALTMNQQHLKNLLAKKQAQQSMQQEALNHRQTLLATLHQNVQSKQQQLNILMENQKALQDIVTHLKTETVVNVSGKSFQELRGKLNWPIHGIITAHFGSALDVGDQKLSGVIIKAPEGTPVHAIHPGNVIFANWLRGFGLLIIINHNHHYMSLYGRNHALYVKVGDHVNIGDVIASTGNSGGFDTPSLYFEIRQNGIPINPAIWCR